MQETIFKMQIKKWTNAVAFLEENEDSLSAPEQNAIKTLQNIWRNKKFGPDCTSSVENMVKVLSDSDKLHHGANNLIQASKEFRGAAKLFYTTDEETFKQFSDYMKKTAGGPQLSDEQQRRREEAQERRRREAEQAEQQRRRQQEEQRRRDQEDERRRQQNLKPEFRITRVEFIDSGKGADAVMGTSSNPFPNTITYIAPKIHYHYRGNGETIPLQITYYDPSGRKINGSDGPSCSMISHIEAPAGDDDWWFYQGFGNQQGTTFKEPGQYRVTIARNGVQLWSGTFMVAGRRGATVSQTTTTTTTTTPPKKKSGCGCWTTIGLIILLIIGYNLASDFISEFFDDDKQSSNYEQLLEGPWSGDFQNHETYLKVTDIDENNNAYGEITVKFKSRTETHRLEGRVLDNDGVYSLLFEDKDVTKNSYLNGRYELTYNSDNLSLFGHYENYSTGKRSGVRLYKGEPDNMEVEEKPAERAERPKSEVDAYKEANQNFLKENKTKDGVRTTSSGLQYKVITNGSGPKPGANDKVKITYKSYLIDGTMTDSAEGLVFEANKVIKGLQEALCMMPVGSKWEVYIPSDLAFGPKGAGKIKPNSVMIFVIELLDVIGADNTASETPNQAEQSATTSSSSGTGFRLETGSADTGADNNIYDNVDVQPEFPGGSQALNAYLGNNVKYPQAAAERGLQGRVIVSFVVERDGSITQAKVVKTVDQDLDREALRVILAMPRWKPGSLGGKNVRVRYTVPIAFRLN